MLRIRSKLAASGAFFAAAAATLIAVSAHPARAADVGGGECGGYDGPVCSTDTTDKYCTDGVYVWVCGQTTVYTYYPKPDNG